jgi:transcriptional regulator with XRE-family HTH domain
MAQSLARQPHLNAALRQRLHRAVDAGALALSPQKALEILSLGDDREVLAALVAEGILVQEAGTGSPSKADAIARGVTIKQRLPEEAGGTLSSETVAGLLGVTRATVAKYRRDQKLLGLPTPGGDFLYPACQFDDDRPLPGLAQALAAFRTADPWYRLQVLLTPDPNLDGITPLAALKAGRTDAAARAIAAHDTP